MFYTFVRCGAQALVNEWDKQERRRREREREEASLYRNRSRVHGTDLSEDEQEEREFRRRFRQFNQVDATQKPQRVLAPFLHQ